MSVRPKLRRFGDRARNLFAGSSSHPQISTQSPPQQSDHAIVTASSPVDSAIDDPAHNTVNDPVDDPTNNGRIDLKNLWKLAYARLEEQDPELLVKHEKALLRMGIDQGTSSVNEDSADDRRSALARIVGEKLQQVQGSHSTLRNLTYSLMGKVLHAKDAINLAVGAEPHAALAWAGVVLFLEVRWDDDDDDDDPRDQT
ncbi:hypothetical protein BJY00DRAFT_308548 [Aspergillus carlsbadensis]|nr:hypothetical protein BJY00DRAFT_308548 [Aspergillus carlsbadensis]